MERLYDFDAAIGYYSRNLACATRLEDLHPAILSNLGFCFLYKQDFNSAEQCCCQAIKFGPRSWEAWKNLGVSFEHQRLIKGAFFAYSKAVFLSRGQVVPVMHLTRLRLRHPSIVPDVGNLKPTVYRPYEIIL
jgi:tetratricopeptide (TPR) repeat protein